MNKRHRKTGRAVAALLLTVTMFFQPGIGTHAADAEDASVPAVQPYEVENAAISLELAEESIVLLKNENKTLPLEKGSAVALYGNGAVQTIKGGTGSGDVNNRVVYPDGTAVQGTGICASVRDGMERAGFQIVNGKFLDALTKKLPSYVGTNPVPDEALKNAQIKRDAVLADTAVYVIRRNTGEGVDRQPVEGDWYLSPEEKESIALLTKAFEKTIVVLNVTSIDASWIRESGVDAVLMIGNPGQLAGFAAAEILCGMVTPSGKLCDTWPADLYDFPSSELFGRINPDDYWNSAIEYYNEDIYVGYRYFDTYAPDKVVFPFGYGLSYTDFDIRTEEVTSDAERVSIRVKVSNTGKVCSGKEVVQVYFSAPQGELDKPYQELAVFGKTDELGPGESQVLELSFPTSAMSSYSEEKAAWIMEQGDYILRVGSSSRDTVPAAVISLDRTVITEQLANQLIPAREGKAAGGSTGWAYPPFESRFLTTPEKSAEKLALRRRAFERDASEGQAFDDGLDTDGAVSLTIPADELENTENTAYAEGTSEDVPVYISAGTDENLLNIKGYNYESDTPYETVPVYFSSGGAAGSRLHALADFSGATLKDVYSGKITLEQLVSDLSVEEMADLVEGGSKRRFPYGQSGGALSPTTEHLTDSAEEKIRDAYVLGAAGQTAGVYIESRRIPNIVLADGPAGIRVQQARWKDGVLVYSFATAFPVGMNVAQTWNTDLARKMGEAVGREMAQLGIDIWLAPGTNIHRNPLCGRNFEYFSEDPVISGMMAAAEIRGVQSLPGRGATIKHFAANNQQTDDESSNSVASERALREIYLKGFEIAIKTSQPMCVMSAYNDLNNVPTANDYELLENILRREWGFDGLVMTDWGGSGGYSDARAMHAGNDLIMQGTTVFNILGYITDPVPAIPVEDGIAVNGGFPYVAARGATNKTGLTNVTYAMWGDYALSVNGSEYVVKTTSELFDTCTRPVVVYTVNGARSVTGSAEENPNELEDWTIRELFDGKEYPDGTYLPGPLRKGTARYTESEEGVVTITYRLLKMSAYDNITTMRAADPSDPGYQETWSTDLFGQPDVNTLTLGDLQKSVCRILKTVMATNRFARTIGVRPVSYLETQGERLKTYETVVREEKLGQGLDGGGRK